MIHNKNRRGPPTIISEGPATLPLYAPEGGRDINHQTRRKTMSIRDNIQRLLDENDTNPSKAAKYAGLAHTAIRDILSGKSRSPRHDTLEKLASHFNVPVSALYEAEDDDPADQIHVNHFPTVDDWTGEDLKDWRENRFTWGWDELFQFNPAYKMKGTQGDAALALGISRKQYNNMENNKVGIDRRTALACLKIAEMDPTDRAALVFGLDRVLPSLIKKRD